MKAARVRCSVTAKKILFLQRYIYLFLTCIARRRNFRHVSFDFESDAKEMNGIFSKFDLILRLAKALLNVSIFHSSFEKIRCDISL